jgi:peptidoglycan/LPS O-acetylase OafA/YrhL
MADDPERLDPRVLARLVARGLLVASLGVISADPGSATLLWSVRLLALALVIVLVVDAEATRRRHPRRDPHPVRRRAFAFGFLVLIGLAAFYHGRTLGYVFGGLALAIALGAWLVMGRQARTG